MNDLFKKKKYVLISNFLSGLNKKIPAASTDETGLRSEDSDYNYEDEYEDKSDAEGAKNKLADSNSVNGEVPHINTTELTKTYKVGDTAVLECNVAGGMYNFPIRIEIGHLACSFT